MSCLVPDVVIPRWIDIKLLEGSGLYISDSMRRSAVKVTPVKMKADLNSRDQYMYLIMQ